MEFVTLTRTFSGEIVFSREATSRLQEARKTLFLDKKDALDALQSLLLWLLSLGLRFKVGRRRPAAEGEQATEGKQLVKRGTASEPRTEPRQNRRAASEPAPDLWGSHPKVKLCVGSKDVERTRQKGNSSRIRQSVLPGLLCPPEAYHRMENPDERHSIPMRASYLLILSFKKHES